MKNMRLIPIDVDMILENVTFDGLTDEQKERVSQLGLPGAKDLFNENQKIAKEAARKFVMCFLGVEQDGRNK